MEMPVNRSCLLLTLAGIFLISFVVCLRAQPDESLPREYPPPGRLIDIGGRKLHIYCSGKGSPTVILIAGGGAFSIDWALVQPKVSKDTRVCSYDRAGLGWSDSGPADETVEQTVADLHNLLRMAGEKAPYLLVGASIGGIFIQAYQRAFPQEVAGLVFSNSSNRIGLMVCGKAGLIWDLREDDIRSAYPLPASAKGSRPTHEGKPFDRLPPDVQRMRLWLDTKLWERFDPTKAGPDSALSWRNEFLAEFNETERGKDRPLGQLPVVVLSSTPAATESQRQSRDGAAARLDFLSRNTAHIVAAGSSHEIHLYEPDLVIRALIQTTSAIRNGTPTEKHPRRPLSHSSGIVGESSK
jgi:pimeloyl-ACP methyl ester carboxylesterase